MKFPVTLTLVILAAASFWGMRERRILLTLREEHRKVVHEAASLGVSTDLSTPFTPTKGNMRQREDSTRKVRDFAASLVSFAKEMKEREKSGKEPDAAMQKRLMEMLEGILSLNGSELKILIAEIRGRSDLDDEMRKEMIGFSIMMLAQQHPQAALALYTESSDMMEGLPMGRHIVSSALGQWAKDQPLEAIEWIKSHSGKHKDLVTDEVKHSALAGAARTDFGLAFQLAGEIHVPLTDGSLLHTMADSATTAEKRTEFLAALRKQAALLNDKEAADLLLKSGANALFSQAAKDGYDKTVAWIDSAKLGPDERAEFVDGLNYHHTRSETGKWLDWISSEAFLNDKAEETTRELVRDWTRNDYKAAGEWLAKSPAGPMKNEAVISYAQIVAPYDTDVAVKWADTLAPDQRAKAIHGIHSSLRQKDEAAAAEFAKRHGLGGE
jgi:hypothetical protein